uniref:Doublecortin domain-containing protein n=1 Tax=Macrostomum lignano TaxID=282301 RepID=A0A1I8FB00_9PLAT
GDAGPPGVCPSQSTASARPGLDSIRGQLGGVPRAAGPKETRVQLAFVEKFASAKGPQGRTWGCWTEGDARSPWSKPVSPGVSAARTSAPVSQVLPVPKGEPGATPNLPATAQLVTTAVAPGHGQLAAGQRARERREPGSCDCGGGRRAPTDGTGGRQNSPRLTHPAAAAFVGSPAYGFGSPETDMLMNLRLCVRIMDSYKSFSDVSYALQEGAIVFTADEKGAVSKNRPPTQRLRLVARAVPPARRPASYKQRPPASLGGRHTQPEGRDTRSYFKVFLNGMYSQAWTPLDAPDTAYRSCLCRQLIMKEILAWQGVRRSQRLSEPFTPDCEGFSNRDKLKTGRATNLLSGSLFQSREITCDSRLVVLCIEAFDENSDTLNPMDYRRK